MVTQQQILHYRGTLTNIRIPLLAKFQPVLIVIPWDPWSKKRVNFLSCIEGKDTHWSAQNAALIGSIIKYLLSLHSSD